MPKATPKTTRSRASVAAFLASVEDDTRRADAKAIAKLMRAVTGEKPAMWGTSIVGYGAYESPTGIWPRIAFSPRKANLVLYIMNGFKEREALLKKLGKHKTGKACLYINRLADVDASVLRALIEKSYAAMKAKYG